MMFGLILIMRSVSVAVMKRFPTLEHIVDAGELNAPQYFVLWIKIIIKKKKILFNAYVFI